MTHFSHGTIVLETTLKILWSHSNFATLTFCFDRPKSFLKFKLQNASKTALRQGTDRAERTLDGERGGAGSLAGRVTKDALVHASI